MKLAYLLVDTLMWVVHAAAIYLLLLVLGGHRSAPATAGLTLVVVAADLAIALPLRRLAQNIQSHTVL